MGVDKKILEARKTLRKIYIKYTDELYKITNQIDKYLEGLQDE